MHYDLKSFDVNYSCFSQMPDDGFNGKEEFNGPPGKQHYKLLSHLSTLFNNSTIIDIGTHRGSSALALSYNESNTVYTFDIVDNVKNPLVLERKNIRRSFDNLFEKPDAWKDTLLSAAFIVLDVDPHNGHMEIDFYNYLKSIGYNGFVVCDDIWYFKEMRDNFWYKIPYEERYDVTDVGHWSGTGIFTFNREITFPKPDNTNWTLVTAYFDLTKCEDASSEIIKRDANYYKEHAISTMCLPYNLIVYCEESNLEEIKAMRPDYLKERTRYIVRNFDDFQINSQTFADFRRKIHENRVKFPYRFDNRNTASYYLFCVSRYIMLKETIHTNTFNSTHFAWINFCIERMGHKNVQRLDEALSVKRDKFSTCYIDYIPEDLVKNTAEYYKWGRCGMCSGFFTGNAEYMWKVCDKIEAKFLHYLEEGYGHADEQLYSPVYFENKDLFEHYYGDYQQMITNYVYIYEAPEPPIYNFIRNSYKYKDYAKCKEACEFVWRSIQGGKCVCKKTFLDELESMRSNLRVVNTNDKPILLFMN